MSTWAGETKMAFKWFNQWKWKRKKRGLISGRKDRFCFHFLHKIALGNRRRLREAKRGKCLPGLFLLCIVILLYIVIVFRNHCSQKKVSQCVHQAFLISAPQQTLSVVSVCFYSVVESVSGLVVAIHSQDSLAQLSSLSCLDSNEHV